MTKEIAQAANSIYKSYAGSFVMKNSARKFTKKRLIVWAFRPPYALYINVASNAWTTQTNEIDGRLC
jgi:hypothetical protein